jgi:hypothetical protein
MSGREEQQEWGGTQKEPIFEQRADPSLGYGDYSPPLSYFKGGSKLAYPEQVSFEEFLFRLYQGSPEGESAYYFHDVGYEDPLLPNRNINHIRFGIVAPEDQLSDVIAFDAAKVFAGLVGKVIEGDLVRVNPHLLPLKNIGFDGLFFDGYRVNVVTPPPALPIRLLQLAVTGVSSVFGR